MHSEKYFEKYNIVLITYSATGTELIPLEFVIIILLFNTSSIKLSSTPAFPM